MNKLEQILENGVLAHTQNTVNLEYGPFNDELTVQILVEAFKKKTLRPADAYRNLWTYQETPEIWGLSGMPLFQVRALLPKGKEIITRIMPHLSETQAEELVEAASLPYISTDAYLEQLFQTKNPNVEIYQAIFNPFVNDYAFLMRLAKEQGAFRVKFGEHIEARLREYGHDDDFEKLARIMSVIRKVGYYHPYLAKLVRASGSVGAISLYTIEFLHSTADLQIPLIYSKYTNEQVVTYLNMQFKRYGCLLMDGNEGMKNLLFFESLRPQTTNNLDSDAIKANNERRRAIVAQLKVH